MAGFLHIDGVPGQSEDAEHKDWINLLAVSENITRTIVRGGSGSTRNAAASVFDDIVCTKELDKSTPKLIEQMGAGKPFPMVKIDLCQSIGDTGKRLPYMQFELKQVIITSYSFSGSTGDDGQIPVESISLNFEEIKWSFTQYGSDGSNKGKVETTWKVSQGKA